MCKDTANIPYGAFVTPCRVEEHAITSLGVLVYIYIYIVSTTTRTTQRSNRGSWYWLAVWLQNYGVGVYGRDIYIVRAYNIRHASVQRLIGLRLVLALSSDTCVYIHA